MARLPSGPSSGPIDVNATLARAEDVLVRQRAEHLGTRPAPGLARRVRTKRKAVAIGWIGFALLFIGFLVGVVHPIGVTGLMLGCLAFVVLALIVALWPAPKPPTAESLTGGAVSDLPIRTERWLEGQRPALPAPAQTISDAILLKLETLRPQLAGIDGAAPEAAEARRLLAEDLPELVAAYTRVPQPLRGQSHDGFAPEAQLTDGLRVVDEQLGRISKDLARTEVEKLAVQGRYLEMKYRGDAIQPSSDDPN